MELELVRSDGQTIHRQWIVRVDGNDRPDAANPAMTMAYIRINTNTIEVVIRHDGKELGRGNDVVSKRKLLI
jgi:hypothetical protein